MSLTYGDPRLPDRFWDKVQILEDGCWAWTGSADRLGYGRYKHLGRVERPYRVTFPLTGTPLVAGLVIDHLCRQPSCCNPAHLEQVTGALNTKRGRSGQPQLARTHCPQGHPYDETNTIRRRNERLCRECGRTAAREYQRRRRAAIKGGRNVAHA